MLAFTTTILPLSTRSTFTTHLLTTPPNPPPHKPPTTPTMQQDMSKSVPFLQKPKNLSGLPASAEFDPLLISDYIPVPFLREAEIKHSRIAMLAILGLIVQELYTFPHPYFPHMLPTAAHNHYINTGGMGQILVGISVFEVFSLLALKDTMEGKREPGYFGFDPLGLGKDKERFRKYQENELRNGRLAMIATGGAIHQMWVTGQGLIEGLKHFQVPYSV